MHVYLDIRIYTCIIFRYLYTECVCMCVRIYLQMYTYVYVDMYISLYTQTMALTRNHMHAGIHTFVIKKAFVHSCMCS